MEKGTRVRAVRFATAGSSIDDNVTVPPGTEGTVTIVDGMGTVFVDWDNGSSIGLIPDVDRYEVVQ